MHRRMLPVLPLTQCLQSGQGPPFSTTLVGAVGIPRWVICRRRQPAAPDPLYPLERTSVKRLGTSALVHKQIRGGTAAPLGQPPGPSLMMKPIRSPTLSSKSRMISLTTSPTEITPTTLPASNTGRWRKPRSAIIAMQPCS
jgi:hypothetical protein